MACATSSLQRPQGMAPRTPLSTLLTRVLQITPPPAGVGTAGSGRGSGGGREGHQSAPKPGDAVTTLAGAAAALKLVDGGREAGMLSPNPWCPTCMTLPAAAAQGGGLAWRFERPPSPTATLQLLQAPAPGAIPAVLPVAAGAGSAACCHDHMPCSCLALLQAQVGVTCRIRHHGGREVERWVGR
jgi:hypothetical protein